MLLKLAIAHFMLFRSLSCGKLLRATEEYPHKVTLTPAKASPVVTKDSKLANGVRIVTRENGSPVSYFASILLSYVCTVR